MEGREEQKQAAGWDSVLMSNTLGVSYWSRKEVHGHLGLLSPLILQPAASTPTRLAAGLAL